MPKFRSNSRCVLELLFRNAKGVSTYAFGAAAQARQALKINEYYYFALRATFCIRL